MLFGMFHERSLATATGVNLGFHHRQRTIQFLESGDRFFGGPGDDASGNGDTCVAQNLLGLKFMYFHCNETQK